MQVWEEVFFVSVKKNSRAALFEISGMFDRATFVVINYSINIKLMKKVGYMVQAVEMSGDLL